MVACNLREDSWNLGKQHEEPSDLPFLLLDTQRASAPVGPDPRQHQLDQTCLSSTGLRLRVLYRSCPFGSIRFHGPSVFERLVVRYNPINGGRAAPTGRQSTVVWCDG